MHDVIRPFLVLFEMAIPQMDPTSGIRESFIFRPTCKPLI